MLYIRKESNKAGWLCMPMVAHVPEGRKGWEKVQCPTCGEPCWKRPTDTGVIDKNNLEGALCTSCALKAGVRKENK